MSDRPGGSPADPVSYEARLEAVLESISDTFYALDEDWRFVIFNKAAERYFDISADVILGRNLWDIFPQGRGTPFEWGCNAAMYEKTTSKFETPSGLRPDRYLELRTAPMPGGGIAVSFTDITDRRRAEDALKAALARSEEVLESISDAFYAVDREWRFTYVNRVAEAWWGKSRGELIGKSAFDLFSDGVGGEVHRAHLKAASTQSVVRLETCSKLHDRWIDVSIFPTGQGLSVYFRDISERKEAEERQRLLVNELNHRVKNTLATVQSIAAQTLQGAEVPDEVRERFTGRLIALAKANDLLLEREWTGATLQSIAEQVASPYAPDRFVIEGPALDLGPRAATAMALALHELATNAAKYGALSRPDGRVRLSWALKDEAFELSWRESGGPQVVEPTRVGFGTRLIQRGLAAELKARVEMDYAASGLTCSVAAPHAAIAAS